MEENHAEILSQNSQYFIRDKGTVSGTFLKVTSPIELSVGSLIEMGSFLI